MEMISTAFSLGDKLVILKIAAVLLTKVSNCTSVKLRVKSQPRFTLKLLQIDLSGIEILMEHSRFER